MTNGSAHRRVPTGLLILLLGLLAALIVCIAVMASVPPVSRDALIHHLAVPKLYLQKGGIYEIPDMRYSYYPMNLDLIYLVPLYFKNDIIPKFIHFTFALLTGGLIFNYIRKRLNRNYALIGLISFLSLPVIVKLSITAYVDLGLVFFSTAAVLLFLKWTSAPQRWGVLIGAAIFCGLAMGTKYNGLLVLVLLGLFVPYSYARLHRGADAAAFKAIGYAAVFVAVALLVFSPWMIRNTLWTHNPFYPLYDGLFNPQSAYVFAPLKPFAERHLVYHETWVQIALIPLRIFFQGQDNNPQYFDGRLNPFLLLLPLMAFRGLKSKPPAQALELRLLAAFAIFYILVVFFTKDMRVRYTAPAMPALVILSMFGLRNLYVGAKEIKHDTCGRVLKRLVHGAIAAMFALNAWYVVNLFEYVAPLSYLSGRVSRDAYIQKYRSEYAAVQYVNANLPADARLIALFMGNRSYYVNRDIVFGIELMRDITKASKSTDDIWQAMVQHGFTHLIVGRRLCAKWLMDTFTLQERQLLNDFWREHTVLLFRKGGYELYRLQKTSS